MGFRVCSCSNDKSTVYIHTHAARTDLAVYLRNARTCKYDDKWMKMPGNMSVHADRWTHTYSRSSVNIHRHTRGYRTNRYRAGGAGCIGGCDASFFSWKMRIQQRLENSHGGLITHPTGTTDNLTTISIPLSSFHSSFFSCVRWFLFSSLLTTVFSCALLSSFFHPSLRLE